MVLDWNPIDFHGFPVISWGFPRISIDHQRISKESEWFPKDLPVEFQFIPMDFQGFPRFPQKVAKSIYPQQNSLSSKGGLGTEQENLWAKTWNFTSLEHMQQVDKIYFGLKISIYSWKINLPITHSVLFRKKKEKWKSEVRPRFSEK